MLEWTRVFHNISLRYIWIYNIFDMRERLNNMFFSFSLVLWNERLLFKILIYLFPSTSFLSACKKIIGQQMISWRKNSITNIKIIWLRYPYKSCPLWLIGSDFISICSIVQYLPFYQPFYFYACQFRYIICLHSKGLTAAIPFQFIRSAPETASNVSDNDNLHILWYV